MDDLNQTNVAPIHVELTAEQIVLRRVESELMEISELLAVDVETNKNKALMKTNQLLAFIRNPVEKELSQ